MEIVGEKSRYALHEHLHLITAPLQVIWGKQDQVTQDVSLIYSFFFNINTEVITWAAFASKLILRFMWLCANL